MYVCIYRERKLYLELRFHKAEFVKEEKWKTLSLVAVFREREREKIINKEKYYYTLILLI